MKSVLFTLSLMFAASVQAEQVFLVPGVGQSQDKAGAIVSYDNSAVTVQSLASGSPLAAAGVEVGDRILQVNFQPITSFARYAQLVVEAQGSVPFTVQDVRSSQVRTVYANLGQAVSQQGSCQYKHKHGRQHHKVSTFDFYGKSKSCTKGDKSVWYETCRDHRSETEELGCW